MAISRVSLSFAPFTSRIHVMHLDISRKCLSGTLQRLQVVMGPLFVVILCVHVSVKFPYVLLYMSEHITHTAWPVLSSVLWLDISQYTGPCAALYRRDNSVEGI